MKKNTIKNATVTTGLVGLVVGNVAGQTDTTRIRMYDPIPVIKIGEGHNFGGRSDSFYELNSISRILNDYDEGKIRPDAEIGDIEVDYFRESSIPGFAEYKMTEKDRIAANTMASCLNNTDNGQQIGELTGAESYNIYRALRKAGYLQNKGDRVKVLFPRTDATGFGTVNGKKAIFPAENHLRAAVFVYEGDDKPCNNCDEDEQLNSTGGRKIVVKDKTDRDTTFNLEPQVFVVYSNDTKTLHWIPGLGLNGEYGKFGFGINGAYMQNNKSEPPKVFLNAQGNGSTTDITEIETIIKSLGIKAGYAGNKVGFFGHVENNWVDQAIGGSVRTVVSDPVNSLDQTVEKITQNYNRNYVTYGPEVSVSLGKRARMIAGARLYAGKKLNSKAIEGAYAGFGWKFGK